MTGMTKSAKRLVHVAAWLAVAAMAAAVVVVWASPVLGLRTVEIQGAEASGVSTEVRTAVALADGTPLARIDVGAVRHRVTRVAAIEHATVARDWPHTLTVTVTERTPVATTQANGQWWLLDRTGTPFSPQDAKPTDLMPLKLSSPGPDDRATAAALGVLASLTPATRNQVTTIEAPSGYHVMLDLVDDRTVLWGSASDAKLKNRVLAAVLQQPGSFIDVSDPTLVTVRETAPAA